MDDRPQSGRPPYRALRFYPLSEPPVGAPELAYLLSHAYWSKGLATEAALCCLDFAFRIQGWPEVVAMVRPENVLSARVLTKIGMQLVRRITVRGFPADLYQISSACHTPAPGEPPLAPAADRER